MLLKDRCLKDCVCRPPPLALKNTYYDSISVLCQAVVFDGEQKAFDAVMDGTVSTAIKFRECCVVHICQGCQFIALSL